MIMRKYVRISFLIGLMSIIGYELWNYSNSWSDLISYSIIATVFAFLLREFILIVSDARAEVKSYEERRKVKYLQKLKPTLSSTEKLYLDRNKDLPYKILKEDFTKFREKIKTKG